MNPYFELSAPITLESVESVLTLNVEKRYYRPGDQTPVTDVLSTFSSPHTTAGIFRGQIKNWPLIPKGFRGIQPCPVETSDVVRSFRWRQSTHSFYEFCDRAEVQNPSFPPSIIARMSIAQHFGVPTPLLDWTRSIFTAIFFAVRDVFKYPEFSNEPRVFLYHIIDERLFHKELPEEAELSRCSHSAFVEPVYIDRRIERQRGVFTYHPYPVQHPTKITVSYYVIEWTLIEHLLRLMKGFGFTEDYFFPDYAGIASAVKSETSL